MTTLTKPSRTRTRRATRRELDALGVLTRVAFYVRVSSEEQTERATAKNQIEYLQKKYQANFDPDSLEPMQFVGQFVDDGYSGALPIEDRPEGKRLLDLVRARGVDVVISYRLDRLGRRLGVLLDIHEEFEAHDVAILSASEPFDTRTPIGKFVFQLLGSIAELERETIGERFTLGRDRAARDGKFINGPVPIGYDLDLETESLVPSERRVPQLGCTESDMIRQIFARAAAGESAAALTVWLRANGVPSGQRYIRRDGTERERTVEQWNAARMQNIIHSTTYYGDRQLDYSGTTLHQDVPSLVSREDWDKANANVSGRVSKFNAGQNEGYVYLLSGKLFCSECGRRMTGNYRVANKRWDAKARLYYVCSSARAPRARRGAQPCQAKRNHDGYALEGFVLDAIDEFVANPEAALEILRTQARERHGLSAESDERVKALRVSLAGFDRARSTLLALVRRGQMTQEEFISETQAAVEEAAAVRHELEMLEAQNALGGIIETRLLESVGRLHDLRERWPAARKAEDRVALRAMVQDTLREMYLAADGAVRMVFVFSAPVSRENNNQHYRHIWRDDSGLGAAVTVPVSLELRRSLPVARPA
jgi:site-specific DNA recombinase